MRLTEGEKIGVDSEAVITRALRSWIDDEISVISWREYRLGRTSQGTSMSCHNCIGGSQGAMSKITIGTLFFIWHENILISTRGS